MPTILAAMKTRWNVGGNKSKEVDEGQIMEDYPIGC